MYSRLVNERTLRCSVFLGRVVCTCFAGYRFDRHAHARGEPACVDVDECDGGQEEGNGPCDQVRKCIAKL